MQPQFGSGGKGPTITNVNVGNSPPWNAHILQNFITASPNKRSRRYTCLVIAVCINIVIVGAIATSLISLYVTSSLGYSSILSPYLHGTSRFAIDGGEVDYSSPSFSRSSRGIKDYHKPGLKNYILKHWEADVCRIDDTDNKKINFKVVDNLVVHPILPRCPTTQYSTSSTTTSTSHERTTTLVHRVPPTRHLSELALQRLTIKVLKFLLTNKGCDVVIDPFKSNTVKEELYETVKDDYNGEFTVMVMMGGDESQDSNAIRRKYASSSAQPHVERFLSNYFNEAPGSVNLLSLVNYAPRISKNSFAGINTILSQRGQQQKGVKKTSTITAKNMSPSFALNCAESLGPLIPTLHWMPSETFNTLMTFDHVQQYWNSFFSAEESTDHSKISHVCSLVSDLVRTAKIGGSIWLGHIYDDELLDIITSKCVPSSFGRSHSNTARSDDKKEVVPNACTAHHGEQYGIEISVVHEEPWLRGNLNRDKEHHSVIVSSSTSSSFDGKSNKNGNLSANDKGLSDGKSLTSSGRTKRMTFIDALAAAKTHSVFLRKVHVSLEGRQEKSLLADSAISAGNSPAKDGSGSPRKIRGKLLLKLQL